MVLVPLAATPNVVTVNVAEVALAGTVNPLGTVASEVLLEVKVTARPPVGAAIPKVTVPVELFPPMTGFGLRETPVMVGGFTVRVAVSLFVPKAAVMVAVVIVVTEAVLTVNVAVVAPEGTVTVAGTVAAALFDERLMEYPAAGAEPPRVSEPAEDVPPVTDVGTSVKTVTRGVLTCSVAMPLAPL